MDDHSFGMDSHMYCLKPKVGNCRFPPPLQKPYSNSRFHEFSWGLKYQTPGLYALEIESRDQLASHTSCMPNGLDDANYGTPFMVDYPRFTIR